MTILYSIIFSIIGYLIGSINFAYLISKYIYKKDLRNYGSGNLGGTNTGRVLGKFAGIVVIILDIFKSYFVMLMFHKINLPASCFGGLSVVIGHCFPIFLNFKGGKGVASYIGFLLALGVFKVVDIEFIFLAPILVFILTLSLTKFVSLSSILLSVSSTIISIIINNINYISIIMIISTLLIIFKHLPNIYKIIKNKENKVKWLF